MPTDALFLFAHQDDEYGVYDEIARLRADGARVVCAYLTDGGANADPERRNRESRRVLAKLGVPEQDVRFVGQQHGIDDCRLYQKLSEVADAVTALLDELPEDTRVYFAAWEGGHHDHDGLHAVAATLLQRRGRLEQARQFPLYNAWRRPGPLFRVLTPLPQNGTIERRRLAWGQRLRQLRLCLSYPSQAKTWLGLLPFVIWRMLWAGAQWLQPVDADRVGGRPHVGPLYYEKRGFLAFERLQQAIAAWQKSSAA